MLRLAALALMTLGPLACGSSSAPSPAPTAPNEAQSASADAAAATPAADRSASLPSEGPGLAVGTQAPSFSLKDQSGQARSLDTWLGQGPVAVVFFRSADW